MPPVLYFAVAMGIPCRPLTTIASVRLQPQLDVPPTVDGTVLISASVLSGYENGPDELTPTPGSSSSLL